MYMYGERDTYNTNMAGIQGGTGTAQDTPTPTFFRHSSNLRFRKNIISHRTPNLDTYTRALSWSGGALCGPQGTALFLLQILEI